MTAGLSILAAAEEPFVKLVIGLIVGAIWVAVQIYGAVTKKPDQTVPPSRRRPETPSGGGPPERVPMPQRTSLPPVLSRRKPPPVRQQPQQQRRPEPRVENIRDMKPAQAMKAVTAARQSQRGIAVHALLRPENLRKAYILTEILAPPVSLRPNNGDTNRAV